jgi:hypothetical protein
VETPLVALILSAALVGCAAHAENAPVRSPTRDYQPPVARTSDGAAVGADGADPRDRLEEGPRVGNDMALAPGWKVDKTGVKYKPEERVGGAVDKKPEGHD